MIRGLLRGGASSLLLIVSMFLGCLRCCCQGQFGPFPLALPTTPLMQHPLATVPMGYVQPPLHIPSIQDKTEVILIGGKAKDEHHHHHHHHHHAHHHGHNHRHDHGHKHGHNHQHNHDHQHKHGHNHDHKHGHNHQHNHGHQHKHGHNHLHGHHHLHGHRHGHEHNHKHGHNHYHQHGHENKHNHQHGHEHKHGHKHKYYNGHEHERKNNHEHGQQQEHAHFQHNQEQYYTEKQKYDHHKNKHGLLQNLPPHDGLHLKKNVGISNFLNNQISNYDHEQYERKFPVANKNDQGNKLGAHHENNQLDEYSILGQNNEDKRSQHAQFHNGHNVRQNKHHRPSFQANNGYNFGPNPNFGVNPETNQVYNGQIFETNNKQMHSGHVHENIEINGAQNLQYGQGQSRPLGSHSNKYDPAYNSPDFQSNAYKSNQDQYQHSTPYPSDEGFMGAPQDPGPDQVKEGPSHHSSEAPNGRERQKLINKPPRGQEQLNSLEDPYPDTSSQGRANDPKSSHNHDRRFFRITVPQRLKNDSPPSDIDEGSKKFETGGAERDGQQVFGMKKDRGQDVKRLFRDEGASIGAFALLQDNGEIVTLGKKDPYLSVEQPLKLEHDGRTFSKSLESQLNSYFNLTPDTDFKASLAELGDVWNVPLFH